MKKVFLSAVLLCGIFISCKKSSSDSNSACTLSSTSMVGKYKITAVKFTPTTPPITVDGLQYFPACDTDNVYELAINNVATITDAGVQCSPSADATGSWSLSNDTLSTTLSTVNQQTLSGKVSSFSCSGFILTGSLTYSGISGTAVITMAKQ